MVLIAALLLICSSALAQQYVPMDKDGNAAIPGTLRVNGISPKQVGTALFFADQFSGNDSSVKINNCLTAAANIGGGTCDAGSMGGTTPKAMSQTISVGTEGMEASGGTVTLILPDKAVWIWDIRDGTSCGIKQFSSSSIVGSQPGGTWSGVILQAASASTSMDSLYCTDPAPTAGAAYIRAEGFTAVNSVGATMASGVIHINPLYDESSFERILGRNTTGDAWHIDNPCCGVVFNNIQGYGGGNGVTTAGYPLVVKGGRAFSITNSTFNGAGTGKNNIKIGGSTPQDITFINTYMEKYITDNTVPMVSIGSDAYNVYFLNGYALTSCVSTCDQVIFENNTSQGFTVNHFGVDFHTTTSAIHDVANGRFFSSDGFTLDHYSVGPSTSSSYIQALSTNTLSVLTANGNLPSISGTSTFTPSGVGWYRVISSNYGSNGRPFVSGTMDVFTEFGFDNVSALSVDFRVGAYNAPGIVTARTFGIYGGNYGPIDQVKVSGDGANLLYVDVHVSTVTSVSPISIVFYGQGILPSVVIPTPVVGAVPGTSSVALVDFTTNDGTFSLFTSGAVVGSGLRSNTGGAASRAACFKADAKTIGVCSSVVASDGTCTCN